MEFHNAYNNIPGLKILHVMAFSTGTPITIYEDWTNVTTIYHESKPYINGGGPGVILQIGNESAQLIADYILEDSIMMNPPNCRMGHQEIKPKPIIPT